MLSANLLDLKSDMIEWFDQYIEERDLQEFKRRQPMGSDSVLPLFSGETLKRIDILICNHNYRRYLNYPAMMAVWKSEAIDRFKETYRVEDITRIFNEVVSEMRDRQHRYDIEELDREATGLFGCIVRHKKAAIACSIGCLALGCLAVVGVFFFGVSLPIKKE